MMKDNKIGKCIMILLAVIVFTVLPFVIEPRPHIDDYNHDYDAEEEPAQVEEPTFNNTKSVYLGYYRFYMPEDTKFEYYDECMTATTEDMYGAICYAVHGAPQTSKAVYELYGIKNPEYFVSDHDVNGVIVREDGDDGSHKVSFCITYDGLFHCIEVWLNDGVSDKAWQTIFSSVELVADETVNENEEIMNSPIPPVDLYNDAYEKWLAEEAYKAYCDDGYMDDGFLDYDGSLRGGWR